MVRQWGAACLCQGDKATAVIFDGAGSESHFEIPPKSALGALRARSCGQQRGGREASAEAISESSS